MILEIDNVELNFKEKNILKGIYLRAETGKVTGILGSNGCGKSCLLRIIFGNLRPKYQLIRIDNKPILKPLYKTKLAIYLSQTHFIPKQIKIRSVFLIFNLSWNDFVSDFELFSIFRNAKFNQLSGGERRIIEVYVVLKSRHNIALLDEPFSHIAPLYIEKIKNLIEKENQNKIIIITDHMYSHITDVSDAVYLIKNGSSKLISDLKELEDYKYLSLGTLD